VEELDFTVNKLILGDNLEILKSIPDECIDLIYLDPFMGGGTTVAVADTLERHWIGIDQSSMAVKVTEFRLEKQYGAMEGQSSLFTAP
jgi:DNA modification methylase